jgi:lysozyme
MIAELVYDEELRLWPYYDKYGNLTIGVGRNLKAKGISRDEAMMLLVHDIEAAMADLDRRVPGWRALTEERQRVLINMCFNMGILRLLGFKKFLQYVSTGQYEAARAEMLDSVWATQVGDRATRLADMMFKKEIA